MEHSALLARALGAEIAVNVARFEQLADERVRRHILGDGYVPPLDLQPGLAPDDVYAPRARNRGVGATEERIRFRSSFEPPYRRHTAALDGLPPRIYLKGVSMGDFGEIPVSPQTRRCLSLKRGFSVTCRSLRTATGGMAATQRAAVLPRIIEGGQFQEGIQVIQRAARSPCTQCLGISPE